MSSLLTDRNLRHSRRSFQLDRTPGLYAIFLRPTYSLPGVTTGDQGLLYIGKADGAGGLKVRCHFNGGTRNHSPRKSLAVVLETHLGLRAKPVLNRDGTYKTWALEKESEALLDEWMHGSLEVAYAHGLDAAGHEKQLISRFEPPLNLTDCSQGDVQRRISVLRRQMEQRMMSAAIA